MSIYLIGCLATFILILVCSYIDYKCEGELEVNVKELVLLIGLIAISYAGFIILLIFSFVYFLEEKGNNTVFKIKK